MGFQLNSKRKRMLKVLLCTSITLMCIALLLDEPIPDGIHPQWKIKLVLGASKAGEYVIRFLACFGINEAIALRRITDAAVTLTAAYPQDVKVTTNNTVFDGVPVRIFTPKRSQRRAIVHFHGGGWYMGSSDTYASKLNDIASRLKAVVVSVDYRLSPEHVYPAALDDCVRATVYFINHAMEYGVDPNRIALMGDSAGGNLVAATTIRLRNFRLTQPKLQVLIYPITQVVNLDTPSYRTNQNGPLLTKRMMALSVSSYLFGKQGSKYISEFFSNNHIISTVKKSHSNTFLDITKLPRDELTINYTPYITENENLDLWNKIKDKVLDSSLSPLLEKNLTGVPNAYVTTCQHDVLRDDGIFYVEKLRSAGVTVQHQHLQNCIHGCMGEYKHLPTWTKEYRKLLAYINTHL